MTVKEFLKHKRITQRKFASMIGIKEAHMSLVVHGKAKPSLETAWRIEQNTHGMVTLRDWF